MTPLGGADTVNFLVTYDPVVHEWFPYFGDPDKEGPGNRTLTPDMGILVSMLVRVEVRLNGNPLVSDGNYPLAFYAGLNLVGAAVGRCEDQPGQ